MLLDNAASEQFCCTVAAAQCRPETSLRMKFTMCHVAQEKEQRTETERERENRGKQKSGGGEGVLEVE